MKIPAFLLWPLLGCASAYVPVPLMRKTLAYRQSTFATFPVRLLVDELASAHTAGSLSLTLQLLAEVPAVVETLDGFEYPARPMDPALQQLALLVTVLSILPVPSMLPGSGNPPPTSKQKVPTRSSKTRSSKMVGKKPRSPPPRASASSGGGRDTKGESPMSIQEKVEAKLGKRFVQTFAVVLGVLPYPLMILAPLFHHTN